MPTLGPTSVVFFFHKTLQGSAPQCRPSGSQKLTFGRGQETRCKFGGYEIFSLSFFLTFFLSFFPTKGKYAFSQISMSFTTPTYPGINLDANEGPQTNAAAIVSIVLSFITLVLRFLSRLNTHVLIELDDWLILVAAVRPHESRPVPCIGH